LPRTRDHPLISDLPARFGNRLAARFAARMAELTSLPLEMTRQLPYLSDMKPCESEAASPGIGFGD
jgi:hypothetical protein